MLDIGVLGVGKEHYYLNKVAAGVEDYYTGRGEAPGYWTGRAAASLGLAGRVDPVDLQAVLAGTDPRDADRAPLGRVKSGRSRPGFDLTFRAPKSVSLLWALSDDATSAGVRDAHDTAVAAALDYLEDAAGWSRRGAGGREPVAGTGFVAAAFRHRASRAGAALEHGRRVFILANVVDRRGWAREFVETGRYGATATVVRSSDDILAALRAPAPDAAPPAGQARLTGIA